jgi:hypothetical protein
MKTFVQNRDLAAFTRMGLILIMMVLFLFTGILLSAMATARHKAKRITCVCHLKQIGLSFRILEGDHNGGFPAPTSSDAKDSNESVEPREVFRYFQAMSNQLAAPLILTCPGDWRRVPSRSFATLSNTNLSYFLNLTALASDDTVRTYPQMFLAGDRHLRSNRRITNSVLLLRTNDLVYWTRANHQASGNIAVADGSVQQLSTPALQKAFTRGGVPTSRLAIP